jgi:hypothetical protein
MIYKLGPYNPSEHMKYFWSHEYWTKQNDNSNMQAVLV